eukprot:2546509-Pyramimonas_sp.AAC.1
MDSQRTSRRAPILMTRIRRPSATARRHRGPRTLPTRPPARTACKIWPTTPTRMTVCPQTG